MNRSLLNVTPLNASLLNMVGRLTSGKKGGASFADAVISGTDVLRISNAKANSLSSLIVGGGCSQNGTPLPTAPQSLISNKGAVSYGVLGNNLLEVTDANIVVGKYINNNGEVTTSLPNLYFQRFVAVKADTAYTLSTSEALNYANFMEYDADGVFIKRTLYGSASAPAGKAVTHTMGASTAFVIVGSNINATKYPEVTKDVVKGIKWMFNEGSSAKTYEAYRAGYSYDGKDEIKVVNDNFLPSGYTALEYIESDGKSGYVDTGIVIDSIPVDVEVDVQFNDANASSPEMAWGYMDNTNNLPRWGFGVYSSKWLGSPNATASIGTPDTDRHNVILRVLRNSRGEAVYNGDIDGNELYPSNSLGNEAIYLSNTLPIYLFARNNRSGASNFGNCKIYGFKVTQDGVLIHDLVPCKNNEDVLGFYDVIAQAFYAGVGTLAGGDTMYKVISKASAEMLLGVGDYADRQDIISGAITRKVGIRVFDGSESSWYLSMSGEVYRYRYKFEEEDNAYYESGRGTDMLCTHFKVLASGSAAGGAFLNGSSNSEYLFMIPDQSITTLEGFRQWLHREYAKGTPVIVVYPLATETTESVAPQTLTNPKGNVTIIRDAEVIGLPMEATLKVKSEGGGEEMTFSIDGGEYYAIVGMTWAEWCESDYCPKNEEESYYVEGNAIASYYSNWGLGTFGYIVDENWQYVKPTDVISTNIAYTRTQS